MFTFLAAGPPQGRFEHRDPVEQVGDQPDGRVVEREAGPQALHPGHRGELAAGEPQLARGVAVGVDEAEGDQPADQVRVQARSTANSSRFSRSRLGRVARTMA